MNAFNALSDPTRRSIVEMLVSGEMAAGDIARRFDVTPAAVSQHLRALREAELVQVRIDGQRRIYRLDPAGFSNVAEWLDGIRRFWTSRIDRLENELRRDDSRHKKPAKRRKS